MRQASTSGGAEYQLANNSVLTVHYIHNDLLETIEDVGFLNADGDEGYLISNPGKRQAAHSVPDRRHGARPGGSAPEARLRRARVRLEPAVLGNWFLSANYTLSRLYGNYSGLASSDEITTPTTGVGSSTAQQQSVSIARPGGNVNRAWDLDELLYDAHGNLDVLGRLATDRPHVVKLYGAYDVPVRHPDRRLLLRRQRHAHLHLRDLGARGRYLRGGPRQLLRLNGQVTQDKRTPCAHPHRPAALARDRRRGQQAPAVRAERAEPVQPADDRATSSTS